MDNKEIFINKAQNKIAELSTIVVSREGDSVSLSYLLDLLDFIECLTDEYNNWGEVYTNELIEYYNTKYELDSIPYLEFPGYTTIIRDGNGNPILNITSVNDIPDYVVKTRQLITQYVNANLHLFKGDTGEAGEDGYTPVKGVDYFDGEKGDKGDQGIPGVKGTDGTNGIDGANGVDGVTPNLKIGTVQAGEFPDVEITGTLTNPILNFVLVKGDKGDTGDTGIQGPRGYGLDIEYRGTYADMSLRNDSNTQVGETYMVEEPAHEYHGYAFFYNGGGVWGSPVRVLGDQGWTPVHGLVTVGDAVYQTLTGFTGSIGTPPIDASSATYYVTSTCYSTDVLQATNIRGLKGDTGVGIQGVPGEDGSPGYTPVKGTDYFDGKSAYEIALELGFVGTKEQWVASLNGEQGVDGSSAYEIWTLLGNIGTEADFIASLKGAAGDSAYQVAVSNGFTGSQAAWLLSLKGGGISIPQILVDNPQTHFDVSIGYNAIWDIWPEPKTLYIDNSEDGDYFSVDILNTQGQVLTLSPGFTHHVANIGQVTTITLPTVDRLTLSGKRYGSNMMWTVQLYELVEGSSNGNYVSLISAEGETINWGTPKPNNAGSSHYFTMFEGGMEIYTSGQDSNGIDKNSFVGTWKNQDVRDHNDIVQHNDAGIAYLYSSSAAGLAEFSAIAGEDVAFARIRVKDSNQNVKDFYFKNDGKIYVNDVEYGGNSTSTDWSAVTNKPDFPNLYEKKIARQSAIPSDTTVLWVDTTAIPATFKYWDGDSWELVGGASNFGQTQADARYLQLTGGTISGPVTFEYPEAGQTTVGMKFKLMNSAITGLYASVQGTDKPILTTSSSANGTQLWAGATKVIDMLSSRITLIKSVFIGGESTPTAQLHVQGASNTSGSKTFRFQNLANSQYFEMTDDGVIKGSNKLNALGGLQENSVDLSAKYRQLSVAIQITDINPAHLVNVYDLPATEIAKLEDNTKWTGNRYTGEPIVNTYQVQEYDSEVTGYWYKCTADNKWIRR